ncbi:MAG: aldehyde dehydrogenase family protein [Novosphingobium sp.]
MTFAGAIIAGQAHFGDCLVAVNDPATGLAVGNYAAADVEACHQAVAAARSAFASWAATSDADRAAALEHCADLIEANADELAKLLTAEQGKPLNGMGSRFEIGGAAAWTRHTASLSLPIEYVQDDDEAHIAVHRRPLGVVLAITPWNWPVMIAIWQIMPAIRAGNTVVLKPSPFTPLSTLKLVELLQQALPPGVLNVVAGPDDLGPVLTSHPDVAKVCFTGSTATGRRVMTSAAPTLKRLTLELGGNDAGIVLPDADPEAIAEGLFWGAFINNGQTCAALKRLFVHDSIYDAVCDALVVYAATVVTGPGTDDNSLLGPLQNRMQFDKVVRLVDEARDAGARILTGGAPLPGTGLFYPITLVADAKPGMALVDDEQFGPALPIIRYTDVEHALAAANAVDVGLGGSVWSSDIARARDLALRLECGTAWVNKHGTIRPDTPFGGIKASGFGVEFGTHGLSEFLSLRVLHD